MQFAKDSFFVTLCERLSRVNPARTVYINGATRAAIVAVENELATSALRIECAYLIQWGATQMCKGFEGAPQPLFSIECGISYGTSGTREDGSDRGRTLTALDSELLQIVKPPFAQIRDYTKIGAPSLNGNVFWTSPRISPVAGNASEGEIGATTKTKVPVFHLAKLTVFFYPEVS
jgi:hypothetical protein